MKKGILLTACLIGACVFISNGAFAQKKEQAIESKASGPSKDFDALKKPGNNANNPKKETKSRGDVYGADLSDININNKTGWYIDIYVDNEYRGTVGPYEYKVTWSLPGSTKLVGKAVFDDGSYKTWGPRVAETGYAYTWSLTY